MALESVHLLITVATRGGGCLDGLSDYSVIKAEAKGCRGLTMLAIPCLEKVIRGNATAQHDQTGALGMQVELLTLQVLMQRLVSSWGKHILKNKQYSSSIKLCSKKLDLNNHKIGFDALLVSLLFSRTRVKVYKTICFRKAREGS